MSDFVDIIRKIAAGPEEYLPTLLSFDDQHKAAEWVYHTFGCTDDEDAYAVIEVSIEFLCGEGLEFILKHGPDWRRYITIETEPPGGVIYNFMGKMG